MLFNSLDFAIFLPIVFLLFWLVFNKNSAQHNSVIVIASYVFYGWWDWRFLFLIFFSTVVDFLVGRGLSSYEDRNQRRLLLWVSILVNLGLLGTFKYFNFFMDSLVSAFTVFGLSLTPSSIDVILPVGISFYTFQTLSYSIDVYKGKLEPTKDFIAFAAFVSFFPQLVAGPIERATNLLPQFSKVRTFDYHKAVDGLRQILWGLFKKMVIADNCAEAANLIFDNYAEHGASTLLMGAIFFAFQIYGDFSGYSDIAIGTARLFGFNLMQNFAFPYFSRDMAEFWRRWHISLSTWFRDYLYIPLGGSRGGIRKTVINTVIIFVVSGLWHGANWTFVIWGALNAVYFIPLVLRKKNRTHMLPVANEKLIPSLKEAFLMLKTFTLTVFAWIFFRAENLEHAALYISGLFSLSIIEIPAVRPSITVSFIVLFILIEWLGRAQKYAIESFGLKWPRFVRLMFYTSIVVCIVWFGGVEQEFIYFQF